jgi:hypothetical protein
VNLEGGKRPGALEHRVVLEPGEGLGSDLVAEVGLLVERQLAEWNASSLPAPPLRNSGENEVVEPRQPVKTPAWLESLVKE